MKLIIFLLAFPLAVWTFAATAQDEDLQSLTLEDLLDVKTEVTGKRAVSTRSASGIVSVLTEEDIVNSGARDLIDLLRTVPSISFGFDVQGVAGIGARGLWAHEGKSLLIIDGIE